jgi:hypothetical protein
MLRLLRRLDAGETISVNQHGREVFVKVIAVWTPSSKLSKRTSDGMIMVEAREIS